MTKQNKSLILILTIGVFGILNTEMGVIGLLPQMAEHFHVSVSHLFRKRMGPKISNVI